MTIYSVTSNLQGYVVVLLFFILHNIFFFFSSWAFFLIDF